MLTSYKQDDLPGFLEAEAEARESDIAPEAKQRHLARCGIRFEEYAERSKDPEFIKACHHNRTKCFRLMGGRQR